MSKDPKQEILDKPGSLDNGFIDIEAHRLSQDYNKELQVKKAITHIPVRRPSNHTWFRIRGGEEWVFQGAFIEPPDDTERYLVSKELWPHLATDMKYRALYVYLDRDGNLGLWPISMPDHMGRLNSWAQSALEVVATATEYWVRVTPNRSIQAYDMHFAEGQLDEPEWPKFDLKGIINLAFKRNYIKDFEDPICRKLRGLFS